MACISGTWGYSICISIFSYPYQNTGLNPDYRWANFCFKTVNWMMKNWWDMKDTLKSPPPENKTMKKASTIATIGTTFFYLFCGGFGYAAFGENTPGNLLTGFRCSGRYYSLVNIANACIVIHLVGSYQVLLRIHCSFHLAEHRSFAICEQHLLFLLCLDRFSVRHPLLT